MFTVYSIYTHLWKPLVFSEQTTVIAARRFVAYSGRLTISSYSLKKQTKKKNKDYVSITVCLHDPALSRGRGGRYERCFLVNVRWDVVVLHVQNIRLTKVSLSLRLEKLEGYFLLELQRFGRLIDLFIDRKLTSNYFDNRSIVFLKQKCQKITCSRFLNVRIWCFFVRYDNNLNIFGFWTVQLNKISNLNVLPWTVFSIFWHFEDKTLLQINR